MRLLGLLMISMLASCLPQPQKIDGCGDGKEFNDETRTCVSSSPAITYGGTLTALAVPEDTATTFTLPTAAADVPGDWYYFIVTAPTHGTVTQCADRDSSGDATGTGTTDGSCLYTPDANYVGNDTIVYRVCNVDDASTRCGSNFSVAVSVAEDNADLPILLAPSSLSINEGSTTQFDLRASRRSSGESDPIFICAILVTNPGTIVTGETMTKLTTPTGAFAFGTTCTQVGTESGNLSSPLARFSATMDLLACPLDDCSAVAGVAFLMCENANCPDPGSDGIDNDGDTIIDEADEYNAVVAGVSSVLVPITVNAKNFAPTFAVALAQTLVPALAEGAAAVTIGTNPASDYDLPLATDTDGDAITYAYTSASFTPSSAGTLVCVDGSDLACTFTPSADYVGNVVFRYTALDSKGLHSSNMTITLSVTGVNDAPVFTANTTTSQIYALSLTTSPLYENMTLTQTLRVGEGGGSDENNQTMTLSATTSDPTIVPLSNIQIRKGSALLGTLAAPLSLSDGSGDADVIPYTVSIIPTGGLVSTTGTTITFTLSDGTLTSTLPVVFTSIDNIDQAPSFSQDPPTTVGLQLSAGTKDITFRATPGLNDWANVTGGNQDLVVTVTSSNGSVIDASALALALPGATGLATQRVGCTTTSCIFDVDYTTTDDPSDDDMTLTITPSIRGSSVLTINVSDGTNSVSKIVTANVYSFTATFNGWSNVAATGPLTRFVNTGTTDPATVQLGWKSLTVLEAGIPTTAYTVKVFRKTIDDFTALPTDALSNTGVSSSANAASFSAASLLDDGISFVSGQRYYMMLVVYPTLLGTDGVVPTASADQVVEVVIPPDNMVLGHRWSANYRYCTLAGQTPDRNNNYRCSNKGLGAVPVGGNFYYDQEKHVFMDALEAGCPFSSGQTEDSLTALAGAAGDIHYERDTATCRVSDGAAWQTVDTQLPNTTVQLNQAELPPLVNVARTDAMSLCANQDLVCDSGACPAVFAGAIRELPTRREMVAAASWPTLTSPTSLAVEDGGDHSVGACNTASASGISFNALGGISGYDDPGFPSSAVSTLALMLNYSSSTDLCRNKYGAWNIVGNAGEWLADTFTCTAGVAPAVACSMLAPLGTVAGTDLDDSLAVNNSLGIVYAFDGTVKYGPVMQDVATPTAFASLMSLNNDRYHLGVAFPFLEDSSVTHPSAGLPRFVASASGTSQIDSTLLRSDGLELDYVSDTSSVATQYAGVHGGDWDDGAAAGHYALKLRQDGNPDSMTGFRCVIRLDPVP